MTRLTCVLIAILFSVSAGACNRNGTGAGNDFGTATEATGTTGSVADTQQPGSPPADAEPSLETQPAREALPSTASPLALAGLVGLLSLAGAAGVRFLRRR